jgi:hypothetical protein
MWVKTLGRVIEFSIIHYTVRAELVEAFSNSHALRQAQGERIWFVTNYGKINK